MEPPFLRWNVAPAGVRARWDSGDATGVLHAGRMGFTTLTVLGPPEDAAPLVSAVVGDRGSEVQRLTLPAGTLPMLGRDVASRVGDGADWDWFWTTAPPPRQRGEDLVDVVEDDPAVTALLRAASPRPSAQPGAPGVQGWLGVRDPDGCLVACGAATEHVPGVPHLASIATHPRRRGRGLGGAVTAALTRRPLTAGAPVVTLGMYADNQPARRMYERLGFVCENRFSSRMLLAPPA